MKLKKIIEYAYDRGWAQPTITLEETFDALRKMELREEELLFDHDFAKAVFGEYECKICKDDIYGNKSKCSDSTYCWHYHLQKAVISKDPIQYYYKHIQKARKKNE